MTKRDFQRAEYEAEASRPMENKSDAELLQFCADELTQLVIEDVISTDAGNKVVVDTCKTLRAIAARLTSPSVDPISDIESPRALTREEADELESLPVNPFPPRRAQPSVEEVIECERCHGNGRIEMLEHCPECLGSGSGSIKEKINVAMRKKYPMAGTVWLIRCEAYGWGADAKPSEIGWRVKTSWPGTTYGNNPLNSPLVNKH